MNTQNNQLEIEVEIIPAPMLPDVTMIEFRNPVTKRGGRINFRRDGTRLQVEFIDLDPGVIPVNAVEDPVEARNILAIVNYVVDWIERMEKFAPGLVSSTKPLAFDGLPMLKKLAKQLELEAGEDELF